MYKCFIGLELGQLCRFLGKSAFHSETSFSSIKDGTIFEIQVKKNRFKDSLTFSGSSLHSLCMTLMRQGTLVDVPLHHPTQSDQRNPQRSEPVLPGAVILQTSFCIRPFRQEEWEAIEPSEATLASGSTPCSSSPMATKLG